MGTKHIRIYYVIQNKVPHRHRKQITDAQFLNVECFDLFNRNLYCLRHLIFNLWREKLNNVKCITRAPTKKVLTIFNNQRQYFLTIFNFI